MQVLPVINCLDFESAKERLGVLKTFLKKGDWIHLDVADGRFTFHKSWRNPTEWANLRSEFSLEVHLMVEEPERYIDPWIAAGAGRLIIHMETLSEDTTRAVVARARRRGIELMFSSNPSTGTKELWPFLRSFSHFQVLAVDPGMSGQKFLPVVLKKIKFLRNFAPNAKIEVDGGMTPEIAKEVKKAGANMIVSASYIFNNKNPKAAYKKLKKV